MSAGDFLLPAAASLVLVAGALMLFAQRRVRGWWSALTGNPRPPEVAAADDPARYAMTIFGMMLLALGFTMLAFLTVFALLT